MNSTSFFSWSRIAAVAIAMLFALGFAAMETRSTSAEEDGAALSNAAGEPSDFVTSGGAIPDGVAAASSSAALAQAHAAPTLVARAHKD